MNKRYAIGYAILFFLCALIVGFTGAEGHEPIKKGESVVIYDEQHRRVGVIQNRGYGTKPVQMRNNQNQITGYLKGNRTYDSNHRRTGTVGKFWGK